MLNTSGATDGINATRRKAKGRRRVQERFWLNARNPRERALGKALEAKKEQRLYSATIRDGIELVLTLEAGDASFLLSRFPNIQSMLNEVYRGA